MIELRFDEATCEWRMYQVKDERLPCGCHVQPTEYKVEDHFQEFWMVLNDNTSKCSIQGLPTFRHDTVESARKEATRLANCNPGVLFYILRTVSACRKSDVNWLSPAEKELMPPF